jgi:hypothetical protein
MIPSVRFLRVLVEGLIPDHPSETAADRARALAASAAFVRSQLQAMPLVLQVLMACGLATFTLVTWLRWWRGPGGLGAARRRAWLHAWAYGRVPIARSLFRPLRSLAALAYFESIG